MKRETILRTFSKMPDLHSERLLLRPLRVSDAKDMFEYGSDPLVTKYVLWNTHQNIDLTTAYLEYVSSRIRLGDFYDWAVVEKSSGKMIGTCGFARFMHEHDAAEIGYVFNRKFWGRGYATESVKRVLEFGFNQLNLNRIEARYMDGNIPSRRVMERCGMVYEGMERESMFVKGEYKSIGKCAILKKEYNL